MFWSLPEEILDKDVKKVWEKTKNCIIEGDLSKLPKSSEDEVAHVRPHGRNAADVDVLPNGKKETKRCFWLNRDYLKRIFSD